MKYGHQQKIDKEDNCPIQNVIAGKDAICK